MVPLLSAMGVVITDADAEFRLIDVDGGGAIDFEEFEKWALLKQLGTEGNEA